MKKIKNTPKIFWRLSFGFIIILMMLIASVVSEIIHLKRMAIESFRINDLVDSYGVSNILFTRYYPIVTARITEDKWSKSLLRLSNSGAEPLDFADIANRSVQNSIQSQVGKKGAEKAIIFVASDSIQGITYCVFANKDEKQKKLFYVIVRL
jgi:hypothetical protein